MLLATIEHFREMRAIYPYSLSSIYTVARISKQYIHKALKVKYKRLETESQLIVIIHQIREDHPTMGVRDLYFKILPESMGRDSFEMFCHANNLMSRHKTFRPKTTHSNGVLRFDNLLIDKQITAINQVWQSDITYFELNGRFYFLTFILDAYSRVILGHSVSDNLSTEMTTLVALKMSIDRRKKQKMALSNLIFHSDGGGQYYAKKFLELTKKYNIQNSMCEYAWENGKAERINGVIKNNYLIHRSIKSCADLVKEVDRSVMLYNSDKPHIELQRIAPMEFEKRILSLHLQNPPTMTESLDANSKIFGASSPKNLMQNPPQNLDVLSANILSYECQ
jgi:putative transposase